MKTKSDSWVSALYDGEIEGGPGGPSGDADAAAELRDFGRLSRILAVPAEIAREDPFFLTRFRHRRDRLRESLAALPPWRRVALRLAPI
ncbi:MAG: hypothetical protein R3190_02215, partial [Thermoanaerobaculia bacterium]|nr:hypothetical protein [Thermoanaerobaculia bacterium]